MFQDCSQFNKNFQDEKLFVLLFKMPYEVRQRRGSRDPNRIENDPDRPRQSTFKWQRIVFVFLMGLCGWYIRNDSLENVFNPKPVTDPLVTPLQAPSAVKSLGLIDMDRFWGSYRPGFYLGMKTRAKHSLVAGFMWMEQYVNVRSIPGDFLRHKCNQDKSYSPMEDWYLSQEFFDVDRYERIKNWMKPEDPMNLYRYGSRTNKVS